MDRVRRLVNNLQHLELLGWLGFLCFLSPWWQPFRYFAFFSLFFVPALLRYVAWLGRLLRRAGAGDAPASDPPASAVSQPAPPPGVIVRFLLSSLLSVLNPWQLTQSLRHGLAEAFRRAGGRLPSPETRVAAGYAPPFAGVWTVARGGPDQASSHSWDVLNQRYAYDFVITDERGHSHRGAGRRLEDYYAFGQPVLAPKDGTVVSVRDGIRDFPRPGSGWIDVFARDFRGNWVVIRHAADEYSVIAHFLKGSIRVRPGQVVRTGQILGLCGNSGHSTEPHIHFHVQDHPDFYRGLGIPVRFGDRFVRGGERLHGAEPLPLDLSAGT